MDGAACGCAAQWQQCRTQHVCRREVSNVGNIIAVVGRESNAARQRHGTFSCQGLCAAAS